MRSMTGFGSGEYQEETCHLGLDIRTLNHRFFEASLLLPPSCRHLEVLLREKIRKKVIRGRVDLTLQVLRSPPKSVSINAPLGASYMKAIKELQRRFELADAVHLDHLLRMEGILEMTGAGASPITWSLVEPMIDEALREMEAFRKKEGGLLKKDLLSKIALMRREMANVEQSLPTIERLQKERVRSRCQEMAGGTTLDEARVFQEVASFLMRHDINEEVERMKSHLQQFETLVQREGSVGKRLDFVSQEMAREINTIAAKGQPADLMSSVIEIKDAIEKIREQLRNVE